MGPVIAFSLGSSFTLEALLVARIRTNEVDQELSKSLLKNYAYWVNIVLN